MTTLAFPVLPGQGWSFHKKPTFSTIVASHVSGREVRDALYQNPIWQFELTFDGLGSDATSYPGLGAQSLQSLMGLFLQCQGQFTTFTFLDPSDCSANNQGFGVGDGTTTSFQLCRALGGFVEPIGAPLAPTAPTLIAAPGGGQMYAPNNLLTYSQNVAASAWSLTGSPTVASGVADPFGGTAAQTFTAGAANSSFTQQGVYSGAFVNSLWVRRRTGSGVVQMMAPNAVWNPISPTSTWQLFSAASVNQTGPHTWFSVSLAAASDAIDIYGAHQEQSTLTSPGALVTTLSAPNFGSPSIFVGGVLVDPTTYSIGSGGLVSFVSAPASGAALTWTGTFSFVCRFDDDAADFEEVMQNLWTLTSLKFRSVRTS